jgi:hypothetical protein
LQRPNPDLNLAHCIIAYLLFLPTTVLLAKLSESFSITQENLPYSFGITGIFHRLVSYQDLFNNTFSIMLMILLLLGAIMFLHPRKERGLPFLVPMVIFLTYLFYQFYPDVSPRYFFTQVPLLIVFICQGLYSLYCLSSNRILRAAVIAVFVLLIVFGPPHTLFTRYEKPPTVEPTIVEKDFNGSSVVLFGASDALAMFHRYYNFTTSIEDIRDNLSSYDYLLFINGDYGNKEYLKLYQGYLAQLEAKEGVNLSLIKTTEIESLFKIEKG